MRLVGLLILAILLCFQTTPSRASCVLGPKSATIQDLNHLFGYLAFFEKVCGRYPLTKEGLKAIVSRPRTLNCPDYSKLTTQAPAVNLNPKYDRHTFKHLRDGWGQPFIYESNGASYRITASHGYSLSDKTEAKAGGLRWDNPEPPPDDPKCPQE
jgi:hypothetical protein